jgi:glutaredoxin
MTQQIRSERPRCRLHSLAAGPDGKCVVCRRESLGPGGAERGGPSGRSRVSGWGLILGVSLLVLGVAIYVRVRGTHTGQSARLLAVPEVSDSLAADEASGSLSESQRTEPAGSGATPSWRKEQLEEPSRPRGSRAVRDLPEGRSPGRAPEVQAASREGAQWRELSQEELRGYLGELHVEIYRTSWCKYCELARSFFESHGIPFREHDVETDLGAAARKKRLTPEGGVPVVKIEGQVILGYSPKKYAEVIRRAVEQKSGLAVKLTGM